MFSKLYPQMYVNSISKITPRQFHDLGIKGIIIDLDNTIIPWKSIEFPREAEAWLKDMKAAGFAICIVSNAKSKRVSKLIDPLKIPAIPKAVKPRSKPFRKAMTMMSTTTNETVVIGDQLFTDILGGNRLGLYTVLVVPMSKRDFITTKVVRQFEKLMLHRLIIKGRINKPG